MRAVTADICQGEKEERKKPWPAVPDAPERGGQGSGGLGKLVGCGNEEILISLLKQLGV